MISSCSISTSVRVLSVEKQIPINFLSQIFVGIGELISRMPNIYNRD